MIVWKLQIRLGSKIGKEGRGEAGGRHGAGHALAEPAEPVELAEPASPVPASAAGDESASTPMLAEPALTPSSPGRSPGTTNSVPGEQSTLSFPSSLTSSLPPPPLPIAIVSSYTQSEWYCSAKGAH